MKQSEDLQAFIPVYESIPDKWEEAQQFLTEFFRKVSIGINSRERGFYVDDEILSGQMFFPGIGDDYRGVFRKVVNFGTLPNTAAKSVAHGLTIDSNVSFTRLYGMATDPVSLKGIPLPCRTIDLEITSTSIIITTTSNRSSYTRCFVVIEYIQEL